MLFKILKYSLFLFIIFLLVFSYRHWQARPLLIGLDDMRKEVVGNKVNPLGLDNIIYMYKIYLNKDIGEAKKGDYVGYLAAYRINKDISEKILNSNGGYLNDYFKDKDVEHNHNRFSLWIYSNKDESCQINSDDYNWQSINDDIGFLLKYTKSNKKIYDLEPWIDFNNKLKNNSSYNYKLVFPFWLLSDDKNKIIPSQKTYFYYQVNRDKLYIHFLDPINNVYIVSMSENQNSNILCQ